MWLSSKQSGPQLQDQGQGEMCRHYAPSYRNIQASTIQGKKIIGIGMMPQSSTAGKFSAAAVTRACVCLGWAGRGMSRPPQIIKKQLAGKISEYQGGAEDADDGTERFALRDARRSSSASRLGVWRIGDRCGTPG